MFTMYNILIQCVDMLTFANYYKTLLRLMGRSLRFTIRSDATLSYGHELGAVKKFWPDDGAIWKVFSYQSEKVVSWLTDITVAKNTKHDGNENIHKWNSSWTPWSNSDFWETPKLTGSSFKMIPDKNTYFESLPRASFSSVGSSLWLLLCHCVIYALWNDQRTVY